MDQPIEENSNLSSLNSNLSAFDSLDPDLQDLVSDIAKRIYDGEKITYDPDLLHHTAKPLVDGIHKGYGKSLVEVEYNSPDYKALENLTRNAFQFSASKDFHILQDMTNALRDGDRVRSFDEFRAEVDKINVKYNQNWLRTEYNQAIAASQATARWQEFQENAKAMPFLQYQAVMDASTRPDHQKLHGVIKRIDNPFWNTHFPPLGWGCRCEVIQLPGKNHKETPDGSFQKPDVPPQFRENFGKEQKLFSDKHPYYQNKCQGCAKTAKMATENNLQCQACLNAMEQCKEEIKAQKTKYDENLKKYNELKGNPEYENVEFDTETGALKASHKEHNFDRIGGKYEKHVQNAGYKSGHSVIFGKERNGPVGRKTEGLWDGMPFEVAGRETATESNVVKGLKHCASKITTEIAVLDYPFGGFDLNILEKAVKRYRGLEKVKDYHFVRFKKIICVQEEEIIFEMDF